jgi:hypothetical protein
VRIVSSGLIVSPLFPRSVSLGRTTATTEMSGTSVSKLCDHPSALSTDTRPRPQRRVPSMVLVRNHGHHHGPMHSHPATNTARLRILATDEIHVDRRQAEHDVHEAKQHEEGIQWRTRPKRRQGSDPKHGQAEDNPGG